MDYFKIQITIPDKLEKALVKVPRKDYKKGVLEIYASLVHLHRTKSKFQFFKDSIGFFDVPSAYLKRVRSHYHKYVDFLLEHQILQFYSENSEVIQKSFDLFEDEIIRRKKYYSTENGKCARYCFLIDPEVGRDKNIIIKNPNADKKWYQITKRSLEHIGLEYSFIKRDSYSRRLHTRITSKTGVRSLSTDEEAIINSYKVYFKNYFNKEFCLIDARACQPTLLHFYLRSRKVDDAQFSYIFENKFYFYDKIVQSGAAEDRQQAKHKFTIWLNGKSAQMPKELNDLFPVATTYLKKIKKKYGYKEIGAKVTRLESKIFIDNILNSINLDFCLSIHDAIIVRHSDLDKAMNHCRHLYGDILEFEVERL
tara:strand:- start:22266 stop:23366 length:1101 start_codon:yes stop_codon:yes gene_type:complete